MKKAEASRRNFIYLLGGGGLLAAAYPVINALSQSGERKSQQSFAPTPGDTLGPYYKKGAPRKERLSEATDAGTPLLVAGRVTNTEGKPVPEASIEVFHADNSGNYDLQGFHYRGQVVARAAGDYSYETIIPAQYGGRPRHIHYVVNAPGHRTLVTQLYFADDSFFGGQPDGSVASHAVASRQLIRPVTLVGASPAKRASVVFDLCLEKS